MVWPRSCGSYYRRWDGHHRAQYRRTTHVLCMVVGDVTHVVRTHHGTVHAGTRPTWDGGRGRAPARGRFRTDVEETWGDDELVAVGYRERELRNSQIGQRRTHG